MHILAEMGCLWLPPFTPSIGVISQNDDMCGILGGTMWAPLHQLLPLFMLVYNLAGVIFTRYMGLTGIPFRGLIRTTVITTVHYTTAADYG